MGSGFPYCGYLEKNMIGQSVMGETPESAEPRLQGR